MSQRIVPSKTTVTSRLATARVGTLESERPSLVLGSVLKELQESKLTGQTTSRMAEILTRFTIYLEKGLGLRSVREIAEEHVEGFVFASILAPSDQRRPSRATMHLRRSAIRLYFRIARQKEFLTGDPTIDLVLPPRSSLRLRPLTDDEIALGRSFSLQTLGATRQPAAWALAEATARTSEIPHIRCSDVDLEDSRVWMHGGSKIEARWGRLSEWGVLQVQRRVAALTKSEADAHLVYEGNGSEQSAQASSCAAIKETLARAGLGNEPDVRPGSIAAWAGARMFADTGRIEEVALRLGVRSLDRAARIINWEWRAGGPYDESDSG